MTIVFLYRTAYRSNFLAQHSEYMHKTLITCAIAYEFILYLSPLSQLLHNYENNMQLRISRIFS
jgi:hypothetical protein